MTKLIILYTKFCLISLPPALMKSLHYFTTSYISLLRRRPPVAHSQNLHIQFKLYVHIHEMEGVLLHTNTAEEENTLKQATFATAQ